MGLCFTKECCCPHYRDVPISSSPEYHPIPVVSQKYPQESSSPPEQTPTPAPAPVPVPASTYMPTPRTSNFMSSTTQIGPILGKPYVDIKTLYDLDKELGRGQFGITYLCSDKSSGLKYACKSISRRKLVTPKDIEDVRREVTILQYLSGQPNIVEFKGAYEDKNNLHLVMELCCGGELFDRITAKGNYSEKEAARIGRQIVNVVHVCHFMGVMHRDLKPENFLMVSKDDDSPLKATDFGLSVFIEEG